MPRVVFVLFDSLNRHALECYGGGFAKTPNFERLAGRATVFNRHFTGSLPCIPARRDIHTGRLNFLHRGWGPLEPYDHSFASILHGAGIPTHMITDHYHYFEDGGFGYHNRYSSWEFIRGQEKDHWRPLVDPPVDAFTQQYSSLQHDFSGESVHSKLPYYVNRHHLEKTGRFPMTECFRAAEDFLGDHHEADNWFLHLECFDPHEPFYAPERFLEGREHLLEGRIFDWLPYGRNDLEAPALAALRARYFALVEACDEHLGRLLDMFDRHDLWQDTWLIVTTDHGLLLGEKEYLAKNRPPFFNEVANIPLFVAAPGETAGQQQSLTQTTDLMPTFLDIFGIAQPDEVTGRSLARLVSTAGDDWQRDGVLFGQFGAALNLTDGRFTYFRYPLEPFEEGLNQYVLMPTHPRTHFEAFEFEGAEIDRSFEFTRGYPTWKLPINPRAEWNPFRRLPLLDAKTALYDTHIDPEQHLPLAEPELEAEMCRRIVAILDAHEAPEEVYRRYQLV